MTFQIEFAPGRIANPESKATIARRKVEALSRLLAVEGVTPRTLRRADDAARWVERARFPMVHGLACLLVSEGPCGAAEIDAALDSIPFNAGQ